VPAALPSLAAQEAGVKLGPKGQVEVDEYCRTSVHSVFAVGDVIDRIQLTPVALMEGMAVAKTVALGQPTVPDYSAVPSAVFCNPEMATVVGWRAGGLTHGPPSRPPLSLPPPPFPPAPPPPKTQLPSAHWLQGLTEEQAVEQYGDVDVYSTSFRPMRNTISGSPQRAFMKMLVEAGSGRLVGCHMVGDEAAEIMQVSGLAGRWWWLAGWLAGWLAASVAPVSAAGGVAGAGARHRCGSQPRCCGPGAGPAAALHRPGAGRPPPGALACPTCWHTQRHDPGVPVPSNPRPPPRRALPWPLRRA
jgi:hypothetical protein